MTTNAEVNSDLYMDPKIPGLTPWLQSLGESLDLPNSAQMSQPLLDISKTLAHDVVRPAAPTSTYLMGVSMGLALAEYRHAHPPAQAPAESVAAEHSERQFAQAHMRRLLTQVTQRVDQHSADRSHERE